MHLRRGVLPAHDGIAIKVLSMIVISCPMDISLEPEGVSKNLKYGGGVGSPKTLRTRSGCMSKILTHREFLGILKLGTQEGNLDGIVTF